MGYATYNVLIKSHDSVRGANINRSVMAYRVMRMSSVTLLIQLAGTLYHLSGRYKPPFPVRAIYIP